MTNTNDAESSRSMSNLPDADMQAVPAALARAARRARELAARSGTPLVLSEQGQVVEKPVEADKTVSRIGD